MALQLNRETVHNFRDEIKGNNSEDVSRCYQCGKCTAGCPVAIDMDLTPNQVMRLIQINDRHKVLSSSTIWLCLSCETCSTRCPENIDIAKVMDTLRKISVRDGYPSKEPAITGFNKIFLDSIKKHGRLNEFELSVKCAIMSRKPFENVGLAVKLFQKGKIKLFGENVKGKNGIKGIFAKSKRFIKEKD